MVVELKEGHISEYEQKRYGRYSITQRKYMYAKKILCRIPYMPFKKLDNIVRWKFGAGGINTLWYFKNKGRKNENTHRKNN